MYGAILGDIIGSVYEFKDRQESREFPLFSEKSTFTDDTVMTLAIGFGLMAQGPNAPDQDLREAFIGSMRTLGRRYPQAGYGERFSQWLKSDCPRPYGSFGNGSAMRVSSLAWACEDMASVRRLARLSAEVTHNHPEGIRGAQAIASAIFLARTGHTKDQIKNYIEEEFAYDLTGGDGKASQDQVSCMKTVPEAIGTFLEGRDLEDTIRRAVTLGGDTDTLAAMAGSIGEAYYGVPDHLRKEVHRRLPKDLLAILEEWEAWIQDRSPRK